MHWMTMHFMREMSLRTERQSFFSWRNFLVAGYEVTIVSSGGTVMVLTGTTAFIFVGDIVDVMS
jgi:hypothetical protein